MKKLTSTQKRQIVKTLDPLETHYVLVRPNYSYQDRQFSIPSWLTEPEAMLRIKCLYPDDRSGILSCTNDRLSDFYVPLMPEIIDIYPQSRLEVEYPELLI